MVSTGSRPLKVPASKPVKLLRHSKPFGFALNPVSGNSGSFEKYFLSV
jgi:hypothetical protein